MIAVLSRNAAAPMWVNKEVAYWLQHRGTEQVLFVVASGQLSWDETQRGLIRSVRMRRCRC